MDKNLEEVKATGEDSFSNDPVTPAGGSAKKNRKGDKWDAKDEPNIGTKVVTPQGTNNAGIHEAITALFGDHDLSEEFKEKTITIFESAVHERVEAIREELEEELNTVLEEQTEALIEEFTDKIDSYLDYVVEKWMEENEVALETGYKVAVAESLFANIKNIVVEHNLDINEDTVDAIAEMEEMVDKAYARYNEMFEELATVRKDKEQLEKDMTFANFVEGMISTDVERLRVLSEGVSYESIGDYTRKLETLKESYFDGVTRSEDQAEYLEEEADEPAGKIDPSVAAYVASLNKYKS
jgi:hypothetical protein